MKIIMGSIIVLLITSTIVLMLHEKQTKSKIELENMKVELELQKHELSYMKGCYKMFGYSSKSQEDWDNYQHCTDFAIFDLPGPLAVNEEVIQ